MSEDGFAKLAAPKPLWLLAELTYACPLQCPYCSNPADFDRYRDHLTTEEWERVLVQARALGAAQLGFSGGEPLIRRDLETLVARARVLGYYTNLITSGWALDEARLGALKEAGLDHIQLSFQGPQQELNDRMAGAAVFEQKLAAARLVKRFGYPMVLNFVLYRENIDRVAEFLDLAVELGADYVELANTQYYGWALLNRDRLLPTRQQLERAELVANEYRRRLAGRMKVYYVVPDYYEDRPKACSNGWGNFFLLVAPDGTALPCHAARVIPGLVFPNVRQAELGWIWKESPAFNRFRGFDWMREPCRSCPERFKDFGGCRCQAYLLAGDAADTDPVCSLAPRHGVVLEAIRRATAATGVEAEVSDTGLIFRNVHNSRRLTAPPERSPLAR